MKLVSIQASVGTVHYVPEKSAFVWKIKQLGGGKEYLMRAHFGLPSVRGGECCASSSGRRQCLAEVIVVPLTEEMDKRTPITVKFEIPYFTVSGIQVRYLKIVEKSGYQALPWVR
jgi:AP-1 complex subunit mu